MKDFPIRTGHLDHESHFTLSKTGDSLYFRLTLWGDYEITPKYINAKRTGCSRYNEQTKAWEVVPMTSVDISFDPGKVQGQKNEAGIKRLKALVKWLSSDAAPDVSEFRTYQNSVPFADFISSL